MRKTFIVIVVILCVLGLGYWYYAKDEPQPINNNVLTYINEAWGISFEFLDTTKKYKFENDGQDEIRIQERDGQINEYITVGSMRRYKEDSCKNCLSADDKLLEFAQQNWERFQTDIELISSIKKVNSMGLDYVENTIKYGQMIIPEGEEAAYYERQEYYFFLDNNLDYKYLDIFAPDELASQIVDSFEL